MFAHKFVCIGWPNNIVSVYISQSQLNWPSKEKKKQRANITQLMPVSKTTKQNNCGACNRLSLAHKHNHTHTKQVENIILNENKKQKLTTHEQYLPLIKYNYVLE